jgi:hypothetical protein
MSKDPPPLAASPEEDACAICLDVIFPGEQQKLSCGHSDFHKACIEKWFLTSAPREQCPKCRAVVQYFSRSSVLEDRLHALMEAEGLDEEQRRDILRGLVLLSFMRRLVETELAVD